MESRHVRTAALPTPEIVAPTEGEAERRTHLNGVLGTAAQRPCRLQGSLRGAGSARADPAPAPTDRRGWARTSGLLFVREALSLLSYSPRAEIRVEESNLDLHVQSVVSCRLDDPGTPFRPARSRARRKGGRRRRLQSSVTPGLLLPKRCFPCHSPTLRPWIAPRRLRGRRRSVLRGGALEPEPGANAGNVQAKADANRRRHCSARTPRVFLSQAGPRFDLVLLQAEHHLSIPTVPAAFGTKKATRLGRPRLARSAARALARMPPSEGMDVSGPAVHGKPVPARQCLGDPGRVGGKHRDVGIGTHHVDGCCRKGA